MAFDRRLRRFGLCCQMSQASDCVEVSVSFCMYVCVCRHFVYAEPVSGDPSLYCDICISVRVCGVRHFMHRCVALAVNHNCLTNCFWTRLTC